MKGTDPMLDEVEEMFERIDVDGDRNIGFEEFARIMCEIDRTKSPSALRARFNAIDTNRDFVRHLGRTLRDPRLHVVEGSAADTAAVLAERGLARADYVISGIPYTTMDPGVRDRILRTTHDVLHPDGMFLVYQFTRAVQPFLHEVFAHVQADFEPRNIMPARLYYCRRHAERRGAGRQREPRPRARTGSER